MRNDSNNSTGSPDGELLGAEDEALFRNLFVDADQWKLEPGWVDQLLVNIERDSDVDLRVMDVGVPTGTGSGSDADSDLGGVIDLSQERDSRREVFQRVLVACPLLIVAGIGLSVLFNNVVGEDITTIPASRQVDPPVVSNVNIPAGAREVLEADDGSVVAVIESDEVDGISFAVTTDLMTWEMSEPLPLTAAAVDISTNVWYVVGSDTRSLFEIGQVDVSHAPTELAVFSSHDRGETWSEIETIASRPAVFVDDLGVQTSLPFTETAVVGESIAVVGDQVVVVGTALSETNWTALARDAGLVDAETFVVWDGFERYFAYGPSTFEEFEITAIDVNMTQAAFHELRFGLPETTVQRAIAGGPFVEQPLADSRLMFGEVEARDSMFILSGLNNLSPNRTLVFSSEDGVSWVESDEPPVSDLASLVSEVGGIPPLIDILQFGLESSSDGAGLISEQGDWQVRISEQSGDLVAEQSLLGSSGFTPVPTPDVDAQLIGGFDAEFGAALVWQDENAASLEVSRSIVEDSGYSFEFFDNSQVTVTNPQGTVLAERLSLFGLQMGRVIIERGSTVFVVDDRGGVLATASFEDVHRSFLRTGARVEDPPARFISWASGRDNWSFAELDGLESAVWNFTILDNGILATALDDPTDALFIEWPEQFGE